MDMVGKNYYYDFDVPKGSIIEFVREIFIFEYDNDGNLKDNLMQFKFDNIYLQVTKHVFTHSTILLDLETIQKALLGEVETMMSKDQLERLMVNMI